MITSSVNEMRGDCEEPTTDDGATGDGTIQGDAMSDLDRREAIAALTALVGATAFTVSPEEVARAVRHRPSSVARRAQTPEFFTPHEWSTVRILVDIIVPRDERSGSATDAGVPEFMDFIMIDGGDDRRTAMRGGLAWLDTECRERFNGPNFIDCTDDQRSRVLDDIAYPERAPEHLSHGVRFFNSLRNMTASGFWSSKMGVEDLQYMGNTVVPEWTGCPEEQLRKLGL